MIELRWMEVAHPLTRRDTQLTMRSGAWEFVLEYREWSEQLKNYSAWKPVPVVWMGAITVGGVRG
jgi:glutaredoxin-related protein